MLYPLECDSLVEHLGYQEIAPIDIDGQRKDIIKREVDRKQKIYSFTRAHRNSRRDPIKIREVVAKQMLARLIRWIAESKEEYYLYYHFRADEFHHKTDFLR
ncbi:MAG TPA: hypothetical protein VEG44_05905 [Candidatus Acidoferrales bacterium]|nr:hypothetical protein [Candidatus Acidoferrales bacterium]